MYSVSVSVSVVTPVVSTLVVSTPVVSTPVVSTPVIIQLSSLSLSSSLSLMILPPLFVNASAFYFLCDDLT